MKKSVYLIQSGELRRKDNTLFFEGAEGRKFIPVEDTKEIMVFGEVDINKSLLEFCTQKEIILHFFNYYGYYVGTYYPREHYNSGYMILKQAEHYSSDEKRLALAKLFVKGAVQNILRVLKYYRSRGKDVGAYIEAIEAHDLENLKVTSVNQLMAYEGNIRETYYKSLDCIINQPDFEFGQRTRQPPNNRLNALISFGNTLLYTQALSEIYQTHLDPRIGFLHTTNFRRFSLNLDIAEIFKPILVDRVIFSLLGRKQLTKGDFMKEGGGIWLSEKGKRNFLAEWETRLATTIKHRSLKREVSYRRLLRLELYKLEKHLMGEKNYEPFEAQW
jgi:CRISPR-associated protein Cas1